MIADGRCFQSKRDKPFQPSDSTHNGQESENWFFLYGMELSVLSYFLFIYPSFLLKNIIIKKIRYLIFFKIIKALHFFYIIFFQSFRSTLIPPHFHRFSQIPILVTLDDKSADRVLRSHSTAKFRSGVRPGFLHGCLSMDSDGTERSTRGW